MGLKRILSASLMSFFLGFLFYLIAASILVDLRGWDLAAEIQGREINIIEGIIKPFAGFAPPDRVWELRDYVATSIIWLLAGLMGGFAGKSKFEGGLGAMFAYMFTAFLSIFMGESVISSSASTSSGIGLYVDRIGELFITEELFRLIFFSILSFSSGFYFGHLSKLDNLKIKQFWQQLDERSNKISLPFQCPSCNETFNSNSLYCSVCGKKMRNEIVPQKTN